MPCTCVMARAASHVAKPAGDAQGDNSSVLKRRLLLRRRRWREPAMSQRVTGCYLRYCKLDRSLSVRVVFVVAGVVVVCWQVRMLALPPRILAHGVRMCIRQPDLTTASILDAK
mgnify:CR=1 FL=1